jgi:hypothetical protein
MYLVLMKKRIVCFKKDSIINKHSCTITQLTRKTAKLVTTITMSSIIATWYYFIATKIISCIVPLVNFSTIENIRNLTKLKINLLQFLPHLNLLILKQILNKQLILDFEQELVLPSHINKI